MYTEMGLGVTCSKKLRQVGRIVIIIIILSFFFFFLIQRTYGTLKQNLVKFKYTQVIN